MSATDEANVKNPGYECEICGIKFGYLENFLQHISGNSHALRPVQESTPMEYTFHTFEDALDSILTDLRQTMIAKQRDYGSGNIDAFGELGVLVRANDKMARLRNLLYDQPGEPKNESIQDTWVDNANYSIIALMLRRKIWGLPLKGAE